MSGDRLGTVVKRIRALADLRGAGEASDSPLLERFVAQGDEAAFEALLRRHAGMVLGVCRRVTGHLHDAEDAFQATFLLLAKKAGAIRRKGSVAGWLHGVAFRVASKARTAMVRRRRREKKSARPEWTMPAQPACSELTAELDEALQALPEKYRKALLLCYFEGRTLDEAARELDCPRGTVASRLAQGRELLRRRLAARGFVLSVTALTTFLLAESASAASVPGLMKTTLKAAVHVSAGKALETIVPVSVATLVRGGLRQKLLTQTMTAVFLLLGLGGIAGTARLVALHQPGTAQSVPAPVEKQDDVKPAAPAHSRTDNAGDPLPENAFARIGTLRFRTAGYVPPGHVKSLAFTPDSKMLLSRTLSETRVWETATGKEISHIPHANSAAWEVSMDGKLLATYSPTDILSLYDVKTGRRVREIKHSTFFRVVRFRPGQAASGGSELLTVDDAKVKLWDPLTGKLLREWNAPVNNYASSPAAFTGDGKLLALRSNAGIELWDVASARIKYRIKLDFQEMALAPDGKLLATFGYNYYNTIRIWDTESGKEIRKIIAPINQGSFTDMVFLPDGKTLATSESGVLWKSEPALRIWDAVSGKELRQIPVNAYAIFGLACSRDGKMLATTAGGLTVRLFDSQTGKDLAPPGRHQLSVELRLSRDNRNLVTVSDRTISVWDPKTGALRRRLDGHETQITQADLARDGRTLVSLDYHGNLLVWDMAAGKVLRRFNAGTPMGWHGIALAPDGKSVIVTGRLMDTLTGKTINKIGTWGGHGGLFTEDGKRLIVFTAEHTLQSWDLAQGRKLSEFRFPKERGPSGGKDPAGGHLFYGAAVSPDERLVAYVSQEKYLAIMEIANGRELAFWENLPDKVGPVSFTPDGRTLAWGGWNDPTVRLVEIASGKERRRFLGHKGRITALTVSPDGSMLVSGGMDTTVMVWDVAGSRTAGARQPLSPQDLNACWADLAGGDAERAYQAIRKLARDPLRAVLFLGKHLQPVPAVTEKQLARLIADLDSHDFASRVRATRELEQLGDIATQACRQALNAQPTIEVRRRLERTLEVHKQKWRNPTSTLLQQLRALEALELAGTTAAATVLQRMAKGASQSRATIDAEASLERLRQGRPNSSRCFPPTFTGFSWESSPGVPGGCNSQRQQRSRSLVRTSVGCSTVRRTGKRQRRFARRLPDDFDPLGPGDTEATFGSPPPISSSFAVSFFSSSPAWHLASSSTRAPEPRDHPAKGPRRKTPGVRPKKWFRADDTDSSVCSSKASSSQQLERGVRHPLGVAV